MSVGAANAQTVSATAPLAVTLAQTLAAARNNTDARIAGFALDASQADVLAADHAPLPVFTAKASGMDLQNGLGGGNVLTRKRIDKSLGIDWTWERGGKRELRTQAAQQAVNAARAGVDDVRVAQMIAASDAFYTLLAAQERLEDVRAVHESTLQLSQSTERRARAGDVAAQDSLRARIETERARADVESARLDLQRAQLVLQQLTRIRTTPGQSVLAQSAWPAPDTAPAVSESTWMTLADARPDVVAAQARAVAAQASLDAALAQKKTDVTWGASLDHYPGTSTRLLELRLQVPLQWGYAYEGEIGRAQAELAQAQELLEKTREAAQADVQRMALEMRNAAERVAGFDRDILPHARQVEQNANLAYSRGAMSLSDLLDARRTLRAVLLDGTAARADLARASSAWQIRTTAP